MVKHTRERFDLQKGRRDYMAHHPFCSDERRVVVAFRIARLGLFGTRDEVLGKLLGSTAKNREGGPPVRARMLVLVTVGEGIQDGEVRSE
jgi:hypothetical protein